MGEMDEGDRPLRGAAEGKGKERIQPNKNRALQVARTGGRKLFDEERRQVFLEWFAATCNVSLAAEKAGVCRQTVSKHRLADPEFAAAYIKAIELALPDLQARLYAHLNGRPKLDVNGDLEPPDEEAFDPQLALQILREQQRMMAARQSGTGRALKPGRPARAATNAEVEEALVKRLAAYSARLRGERNPPGSGDGGGGPVRQPVGLPPPRAGGE